MPPAKDHKHTRITPRCRACRELQRKWYDLIGAAGFVDIEYGLSHPIFTAGRIDPNQSHCQADQEYYEAVWQVFHHWEASKRPLRDCRVAELFAAQSGKTGTIRGIAAVLRLEKLSPRSFQSIVATLKEISLAARSIDNSETESTHYVSTRNACA